LFLFLCQIAPLVLKIDKFFK